MEKSTRDLAGTLPWTIRQKLAYNMDYVNERFIDIAHEEGKADRIDAHLEVVELIFFLRLVRGYLVTGYHNLDALLAFFETKGIEGFQIGSQVFGRHEALTTDWSSVAGLFDSMVSTTPISAFVFSSARDDELIRLIVTSLL